MEQQKNTAMAINSAYAGLTQRNDLKGKRYINWLRCSTLSQSDTSPEGQKEVNDAYSGMQQMRWAGYDYYAEGVSGSQTFNREDIDEILSLKRLKDDFDVVVVFELSRATRGGIRHGNVLEDRLRKAGIELISSTELIPDGPLGDLIKAVKHFSNQQQAYNISKSVARGLAQSLEKCTRPSSGITPFGLDRLYKGPNGVLRTLIRWEGLTQIRLDPNTLQEVSRSVRPEPRAARKKGVPRQRRARFIGYRKQDDETSELVPGSQEAQMIIIEAWRMHYIQNLGAHRLIKHLRSKGMRSPTGGDWCITSIHNILHNYIYLGVEVRHRWTGALYHQLGPHGPIPVSINQDQLEKDGKLTVPVTERPRDEWKLVDKPELWNVLPPELRQAALPYITKLYDLDEVKAKQIRRTKRKNKSDDNPYVLSHILHSKQTGRPMRGNTNTRRNPLAPDEKIRRRYYFDYSTASAAKSGLIARRVHAPPLEDSVVPAIFQALLDRDWVMDRVRRHLESKAGFPRDLDTEKKKLIAEIAEITRRLKRVHQTSGHLSDEDLEQIVSDDNARLINLRRGLREIDSLTVQQPPTIEEAIQAVSERLLALPADWRSLPNAKLKDLLKIVVSDLKIDLETLDVSVEIVLPSTAGNAIVKFEDEKNGRVSFTSAWQSLPDATSENSLTVAVLRCRYAKGSYAVAGIQARPTCYRCRREAA